MRSAYVISPTKTNKRVRTTLKTKGKIKRLNLTTQEIAALRAFAAYCTRKNIRPNTKVDFWWLSSYYRKKPGVVTGCYALADSGYAKLFSSAGEPCAEGITLTTAGLELLRIETTTKK